MAAAAKFFPGIGRWGLGLVLTGLAMVPPLWALDLPSACPRSSQAQDRPELARLLQPSPPSPGGKGDYRDQIHTTVSGVPRLSHWCVWIEPGATERRWQPAIEAALRPWQAVLPIEKVPDPDQAQVLVLHGRPPLVHRDGRQRASHGRTTLSARYVQRAGQWRLEPSLVVMVDSTQRQAGIQATALHEFGHAFGLWGHSPDPGDGMAVAPGARPVLQLSPRDLATLQWLYRQPTEYGRPWTAATPDS
jgi:predicted Zn-dependent protease